MTVTSRSINTSNEEVLKALKALAGVVGLDGSSTTFTSTPSEGAVSVEMTVTAKNSFSGKDVTYNVSGLLECARSISGDSGLWAGSADMEKWVGGASALVTGKNLLAMQLCVYERHLEGR